MKLERERERERDHKILRKNNSNLRHVEAQNDHRKQNARNVCFSII